MLSTDGHDARGLHKGYLLIASFRWKTCRGTNYRHTQRPSGKRNRYGEQTVSAARNLAVLLILDAKGGQYRNNVSDSAGCDQDGEDWYVTRIGPYNIKS